MRFEQRRLAPLGLGGLVDFFRLAALLDLAFDHPIADAHAQNVDRRLVRQGKDVDALDPGLGRVEVMLTHPGAGHRAGDVDFDLGGQQGGGKIVPRPPRLDHQAPERAVLRGDEAGREIGGRRHGVWGLRGGGVGCRGRGGDGSGDQDEGTGKQQWNPRVGGRPSWEHASNSPISE